MNLAIENMTQGLCMFDSSHRIVVCNSRFEQLYALSEGLLQPGARLWELWDAFRKFGTHSEEQLIRIEANLVEQLRALQPSVSLETLRNGRTLSVTRVPLSDGGWVTTVEDVSERTQAQAQVAYMAHHDSLTGLPNRFSFRQDLQQKLAVAMSSAPIAVLCIDLDRFKAVNDTLGHPVGDKLLKLVAHRLKDFLPASGRAARLGGDEFAVILSDVGRMEDAGRLAAQIIDSLSAPYEIDGYQVLIGASIGIALGTLGEVDPDRLVSAADLALYRAKSDGRGTFRYFEPSMEAKSQDRRQLEIDLRAGISRGEFEVHYQPILSLRTNRISCFEALLRWHHPTRGLVPPSEFIPVAEDVNLITEIGAWVLRQACQAAARWPEDLRIAVNLSPKQFCSATLISDVK